MLAHCKRELCNSRTIRLIGSLSTSAHYVPNSTFLRLTGPKETYADIVAARLTLVAGLRTEADSSRQHEKDIEHSRALSGSAASSSESLASTALSSASHWRGLADMSLARGPSAAGLTSSTRTEQSEEQNAHGHNRELSTSSTASTGGDEPQASTSGSETVWSSTAQVQNPARPPWTPTRQLQKRNFLPRRMGHLMQVLENEQAQAATLQRKLPEFRAGDVLQLKLNVPENRRRPAVFKGICIAKKNRGWRSSFTLRNHLGTAGAVERTFPLFSPTIQEISVLERRKVRRAKLYYLRDRKPKEYTVK